MPTRHLGRVPDSASATADRRRFGLAKRSSVRSSGSASVSCLVKAEGVVGTAAVALALFCVEAGAQAPPERLEPLNAHGDTGERMN
jgi:hypothetical protein